MDRFERARQLRDDYESSLDEAEKLRAAYHREILKLHRSGLSLREIAEQLGISHQRVHQIVGVAEEPRRRGRVIGGAAGVIVVVIGLAAGWVAFHGQASAPPSALPSVGSSVTRPPICYAMGSREDPSTLNPMNVATLARSCSSLGTVVVIDPRTGNVLAMVVVHPRTTTIDRGIRDALQDLVDQSRATAQTSA